jgi:hypothetical protein
MTFVTFRARVLPAILLLVLGTLTAADAKAQQSANPLPLIPGARVRVSARSLVVPLIANYMQTRGDTAVFIEDAAGRGLWSIPIADITRLERAEGDRTRNRPYMIRGAWMGAAAGGAGLFLFSAVASPSDTGLRYSRSRNALAGAAVGAAVGALIASRFAVERWVPVPLRQVSIGPSRRGIGLAFAF